MRLPSAWVFALICARLVAQTASGPDAIYARTRARVLEQIGRLPRYTCVQTITRHVYHGSAAHNTSSRRAPDCDRVIRNHLFQKPALVEWDRLRIDVAIANQQEVYSWVGASRFEQSDLSKLVGRGQTTMGDFGSLVLSIFSDHPEMHFDGERKVNGRRLLEFSYKTAEKSSHYEVRVSFVKFITAYSGSVFLDAETGDLVRVTALSAMLPEQSGYCQVSKELDYTRLRVGSGDVLIPSEATSTAIDHEGDEMASGSAYSSCREYVGESVLRFDVPAASEPETRPAAGVSVVAASQEIPPGLPFESSIVSTIDSDTAAAGDPIQAVLRTPIADPSGKILAPAGARIYGRLMGFIQHPPAGGRKESFEIQVQFRSLDRNGVRVPLAAKIVEANAARTGPVRLNLDPQTGTFVFYEKKLHVANIDAQWVTSAPTAEPPVTP